MNRSTSLIPALCGLFLAASAYAQTEPAQTELSGGPSLGFVGERGQSLFFAEGLSAEHRARLEKLPAGDRAFRDTLAVFVRDPAVKEVDPKKQTAMAGTYTLAEGRIRFVPQFPLQPGVHYQAVLMLPDGTRRTCDVSLPKPPAAPAAKVTAVWPTADVLPENQLRFYLHFSAPMSRGEAYDHLRIVDETEQAAELPILELGEELWDKSGQRLTILIDPGRIKRGVKPREDLGTVFKAGRKYTLEISKEWRDAQGEPLAADFRKSFRIAAPVDEAIQPADWKLEPPKAGTRDPLTVRFPRPLDRALLQRTIRVETAAKSSIVGEITVADGEQRWEFRPSEPWPGGKLDLVIEPTLEDLAGNRIGRPFEVVGGATPTGGLPEPYRLRFEAKAQ